TASRTATLEQQLPADFPTRDLWKPVVLAVVALAPLIVAAFFPFTWRAGWSAAVPAGVLGFLIAVMLWPSAGTHRYLAYKTPLFIFTIVFEEWIMLAGVALHVPSALSDKDLWFQLVLVGFFLGTVAISLPGVEGEYRKGVFFRPDLLYGNGAYLARGEIFVALGIKLFISPEKAYPIWNWWGLEWAIFAMVLMVPFRGILKMRMRRARFLDLDNWMGRGLRPGLWVKEVFLFVSLVMLVYGFANAYMGLTPFTWVPGHPMHGTHGPNWWGLAFLAGAFIIIVGVRGWYKTRLAEPASAGSELVKGLLLWVGFVGIIYGFLLVLMGVGWLALYGSGSPNFWWGVWASALGLLMVGPLRVVAQRQELKGLLRIMIPRMADLDEGTRRVMMGRRLEVVAAMAERPCNENVALMMKIIGELPDQARKCLVDTRTWVVANADDDIRVRLMAAMAKVLGTMQEPERRRVMTEVMGSVAQLPDNQRVTMVTAMSQVMGGG
ncbi:MAG: hypothetical protein ACYCZM_10495, partial [Acidimicrobiales bacterium]